MKVIIERLRNTGDGALTASLVCCFYDPAGTVYEFDVNVNMSFAGISTPAAFKSAAETAILDYATLQSYSMTAGDILWIVNPDSASVVSRSFSTPSLAVNTARQASTSRDAFVSAAVDISASLSLSGGQTGRVSLQYADNNTFTTNLVTANPAANGNTGTLTIGLGLTQLGTATVCGIIPANKYYRLLTTDVSGTPTFGTPTVQEVLL